MTRRSVMYLCIRSASSGTGVDGSIMVSSNSAETELESYIERTGEHLCR